MADAQPERLTIVQLAGDFREAAQRLAQGGGETYRAQAYSVRHVEALAARMAAVTVITCRTDAAYDVTLASGVRAIGFGFTGKVDQRAIAKVLAASAPDRLILRSPMPWLVVWAVRRRCRTLMLLADSFGERSVKRRLVRAALAALWRRRPIEWVANHGRRAAADLVAIGVPADKVIAWDFPSPDTPADRPAKFAPGPERRLLYVGVVSAAKGVDDLIAAVRLLAARGVAVRLDIVGGGETDRIEALIAVSGIADRVRLVGRVANGEIVDRMAAADVVVVPSRHDYPEGLPLTIYEALCARTPLILSDHPMFAGNIVDGVSGLVFPAGDAAGLADRIERLLGDAALYSRLSANGADAWTALQLPVTWGELIDRWLDDAPADRAWLSRHTLPALAPPG